jgi:hypothetical protein
MLAVAVLAARSANADSATAKQPCAGTLTDNGNSNGSYVEVLSFRCKRPFWRFKVATNDPIVSPSRTNPLSDPHRGTCQVSRTGFSCKMRRKPRHSVVVGWRAENPCEPNPPDWPGMTLQVHVDHRRTFAPRRAGDCLRNPSG